MMLPNAMHSIRSLLCTATNPTPHERFFAFRRRSSTGATMPTWLNYPGSKAYPRRFVRTSKTDPLVDEVEIINVNLNYANVRHLNGREVTVSLNDLSPSPLKSPKITPIQMRPNHQLMPRVTKAQLPPIGTMMLMPMMMMYAPRRLLFCLGGLLEQPKVFPHSGMVSTTPLCNSAYICGANCVYC